MRKKQGAKMNQIITNEIAKLLGKQPNEDELQSAIQYLDGCADDLTRADDIAGILHDWRDNCMERCTSCGQYHLQDDMFMDEDSEYLFCDAACAYDWKNGYCLSQLDDEEYTANVLR